MWRTRFVKRWMQVVLALNLFIGLITSGLMVRTAYAYTELNETNKQSFLAIQNNTAGATLITNTVSPSISAWNAHNAGFWWLPDGQQCVVRVDSDNSVYCEYANLGTLNNRQVNMKLWIRTMEFDYGNGDAYRTDCGELIAIPFNMNYGFFSDGNRWQMTVRFYYADDASKSDINMSKYVLSVHGMDVQEYVGSCQGTTLYVPATSTHLQSIWDNGMEKVGNGPEPGYNGYYSMEKGKIGNYWLNTVLVPITGTSTTIEMVDYTFGTDWGIDLDSQVGPVPIPPTPPTYTVNYYGNGATSGSTPSQTKQHNVNLTLRNNGFGRTGYSFVRWNTNSSNTGTAYNQGAIYTANANLNLYAIWTANKYTNTLKYNSNKPSAAPTNPTTVASDAKTVTYPNTQSTHTVKSGPALTGYTFAGWYTAASGGSKLGSTCTVGQKNYPNNQSATVYAHWTAKQYTNTLNYNSNKPSAAPTNPTTVASDAKTVTYPNTQSTHTVKSGPALTGYTFAGWYTAASGGSKLGSTHTVGQKNYPNNQSATVYAHWTANKYTNTLKYDANVGTGILTKAAPADQTATVTYPNTVTTFNVSTVRPGRKGYTFTGWYTAKTGGSKVGTTYTVGSQNYAGPQTAILYAHWTANKYHVTYDKNADNAVLIGEPTEEVYFDSPVDVSTEKHSAIRYGWSFLGWHRDPDSTDVYKSYILKDDFDITMYAIYKRGLTLVLAEDTVTDISSEAEKRSFVGEISTKTDTFNYNDSKVVEASTRTQGTYTATFKKNGESLTIDNGGVVDKETGRQIATGLQPNGTILATRYFVGWSDTIQLTGHGVNKSDKMPDYDGTLIGTSGSAFYAKCYDTSEKYTDYDVTGNTETTVTMKDSSNTITIYPQYARTYIVLPDARRHQNFGPDDGTEKDGNQEDTFIGWFTKPQPDDGGTGDGGEYYGSAGDMVRLDEDVTLYPWFNVAPVMVKSYIGDNLNDSELGNGFFEGQKVTYDQLLTLVDAFDRDNPEEVGPADYSVSKNGIVYNVEFNGTHSWFDLFKLNARDKLKEAYPELGNEEIQHILDDNINVTFWPTITGITYYQDGTDKFGNPYPAGVSDTECEQDHDDVLANGLNTTPENVGRIVIHYQITDNGTFADGVKIMKGTMSPDGVTPYTIDSPITVNFDLDCSIFYNYHPRLTLTSTYMYTGDEAITKSNIEEFLWKKQDATDREDDKDRKPWWYKSETSTALDDSIKIIGVYDIRFESGYYQENKAKCQNIQKIVDIKELFDLKKTDYEAFKHITSFKVEWDCVDQWGKTASGYLMPGYDYEHNGGYNVPNLVSWKQGDVRPKLPYVTDDSVMTQAERTMMVIMFNNEDDYDLFHANVSVSERMRYIDSAWADYLSEDSYWGDSRYGKSNLTEIFNKYTSRTGGSTSAGTMENHDHTIQIKVNDYTE